MYLPMAEYVSKLSWRKTQWQRDRGERKGEDFLERENRGSDWTKEEEEEKKKDLKCEVGVIYTEVKSALVEAGIAAGIAEVVVVVVVVETVGVAAGSY